MLELLCVLTRQCRLDDLAQHLGVFADLLGKFRGLLDVDHVFRTRLLVLYNSNYVDAALLSWYLPGISLPCVFIPGCFTCDFLELLRLEPALIQLELSLQFLLQGVVLRHRAQKALRNMSEVLGTDLGSFVRLLVAVHVHHGQVLRILGCFERETIRHFHLVPEYHTSSI